MTFELLFSRYFSCKNSLSLVLFFINFTSIQLVLISNIILSSSIFSSDNSSL